MGRKLLGIDLEEFEKCAFVRQSDLEQVVPAEEKTRRAGTLQARLESAADTRGGDTNATEALQLLENAVRKYTCPEVEFTGMVENALQRLETKRGVLESEVKSLEHDLERIAEPLGELTRLGEEESAARLALAQLDDERKDTLANELRAKLREDDEHRAELAKLEAELKALGSSDHMGENAEAELSQTVGQLEQAERNLEALETRHREETASARAGLESELKRYTGVSTATAGDADRLIALAAEMRRVADEDGRRRTEIGGLREQLAGRGIDPERVRTLTRRFDGLDDDRLQLLRGQSELGMVYQSDLGELEAERTESTEMLRAIDGRRSALRVPGWLLVALGLGGGLAGGALVAIAAPERLWAGLITGGSVLVFIGALLLVTASSMRKRERAEALRRLSEAQRHINQLRTRRAESETALTDMARALGFRDPIEMMRDWNEYSRVQDQNAPVQRAQEQLVTLETSRRAVFEETRTQLERFGGGPPEPGHLERVAADIRDLVKLRERIEGLDKNQAWVQDVVRPARAEVAGYKDKAQRILQSAGMVYDPQRSWQEHQRELAERARGRQRRQMLRDEMVPRAKKSVLAEAQRGEIEQQLQALEADGPDPKKRDGEGAARSAYEVEKEAKRLRDRLDEVQKRKGELRGRVDEVCRKYETEHSEKRLQIERLERALEKARRFKKSVDLAATTIKNIALDTHKRWAEFLNQRVAELLEQVGTRVTELRFGDDLDFSVKLWNGQQMARGKAVSQMSTGARDQLFLAIRLAISEYLSPKENPMPILIDDVFATSDDERARAGMRLLIEHFAQRHQIIVVSCHRQRLEHLSKLDPELYKARVQWLDARTTSFAR